VRVLLIFIVLLTLNSPAVAGNWNTSSGSATATASNGSGFSKFRKHGSGWKKHNYQVLTDETKARAGKKYQRFELQAGDCFPKSDWNDCKTNRARVEFSAAGRPRQKPIGQQCYGFSLMLDKTFPDVYPTTTMLGQVKPYGNVPVGKAYGFKSFPQIVSIKANRKKLQFQFEWLYGEIDNFKTRPIRKNIADIADMLDVWTDISFCLDFANNNLEAWVNGVSKAKIDKSPVTWAPDSIYFKYGIYNSLVDGYKKRWDKEIPTQIVFYDEIRRGTKVTDVDVNLNPALRPLD
jgi:hypothetical protein